MKTEVVLKSGKIEGIKNSIERLMKTEVVLKSNI